MPDIDDIKAKVREPLDASWPTTPGVQDRSHRKQRAPKSHGPMGGVHVHRRKAGGGA